MNKAQYKALNLVVRTLYRIELFDIETAHYQSKFLELIKYWEDLEYDKAQKNVCE
jgi:hypothetical protein